MANIKSQKKRNRQNEKRRIYNTQVKSSIRTANKKVLKYIESKETKDKELVDDLFKNFVKLIDSAVGKGIVKKNTAARKKSRLSKKINKTFDQAS